MGWQQDEAERAANLRGFAHQAAQKAAATPAQVRCIECGSVVALEHAPMMGWVRAVPSVWACGFDHARAVNRARLSSSLPPLNFERVGSAAPPAPSPTAPATRAVETHCRRSECREVVRFHQTLNASDGQWGPDVSAFLKMAGWREGLCSGNCEAVLAGDAKLRHFYEPAIVPVTKIADVSYQQARNFARATRGVTPRGLPEGTEGAIPPNARKS